MPLAGGHLPGCVARPQRTRRALPGRHPGDDLGHLGGELAGASTREWKRDDPAQVVLPHRLRQPDLSGEGAGVGGLVPVARDEDAPLRPVPVGGVVHADDGDLVVGEQVPLDRLAEASAGGRPCPNLAGSSIEATSRSASCAAFNTRPGEVARGGGHEQPSPRLDRDRRRERWRNRMTRARDPVGLVGDHQVERGHPSKGERVGDLRGGLVGREHHSRARPPPEERGYLGGVGGDGDTQLAGVGDRFVLALVTVSSEQTGRASNGSLALVVHSRMVCFSSDSDGTSTSVRSASSFSLMNSE